MDSCECSRDEQSVNLILSILGFADGFYSSMQGEVKITNSPSIKKKRQIQKRNWLKLGLGFEINARGH